VTFEDYWEEWKDYFYMNVEKDEAQKIWDAAVDSVCGKETESKQELADAVIEFFKIMDTVEESSNTGREFRPTTIRSCRVMHTERLSKLLPEMKRLAQEAKK
jgi:hypothetical protein